jgi:uncharacterized protein HemY
MEAVGFGGLVDWWRTVSDHRGAGPALSTLYVQLGRGSSVETAKFLVTQALDLTPGSFEALELFERLIPPPQASDLQQRYEAFLKAAPFHKQSPRVREKLIDLLVEHRQYDAALAHVRVLTRMTVVENHPSEEIARACSVPLPGYEPVDSCVELDEFDLDPIEFLDLDIEIADAAE